MSSTVVGFWLAGAYRRFKARNYVKVPGKVEGREGKKIMKCQVSGDPEPSSTIYIY